MPTTVLWFGNLLIHLCTSHVVRSSDLFFPIDRCDAHYIFIVRGYIL
jgi:hypothetical protein